MNKNTRIWTIIVFGAAFSVLVTLIVKLFLMTDTPASLVIAIVALSGLLILSPRLFELVELTVSKEGIIARIRGVEAKVEETEQKIDRIFAYTMSDSVFNNLKKLATGHFGHFKNNGGLRRELRHLRDSGYITVKGHIGDLPDEGPDLSEFVAVTPVGRQFLELRMSLEGSNGAG